jgi:hypothetical protein
MRRTGQVRNRQTERTAMHTQIEFFVTVLLGVNRLSAAELKA